MGPKVIVMYKNNHFCFKGSLTSVISSASYFKKPKIFFGEISGNGTEFWDLVTAWPPNWGYGVRLIRPVVTVWGLISNTQKKD